MLKNLKTFSLAEIEEKILAFWRQRQIFKKTLEKPSPRGKFIFFEGPPTANGMPGIHHMEGRAFKDVIPRFKTMQGFHVPRKAGWDTHGLPVELQTEKELGMKNKNDIEKYGIAEFNAKCKELVWRYRSEFEANTERMGFWLDLQNPYVTYSNSYIESVWWLLSEINKTGLLRKLLRTVPWCTRCQTPLSSHELGQPDAYQTTKDPSVFIKFKVKNPNKYKLPNDSYFIAWTTTPWTLPGNLALAVAPSIDYVLVENYVKDDSSTEFGAKKILGTYILAKDIFFRSTRDGGLKNIRIGLDKNAGEFMKGMFEVLKEIKGSKLIGLHYEPLYPLLRTTYHGLRTKKIYRVLAGDFVSTEDGSGIVHIAPSFGEEDFKLMGIKEGLPVTIDDRGFMAKGYPGAGKYIKEADTDILADLTKRGLLYEVGTIEHEYPYCWRCKSPLVYMVRTSWFIEMSKLREKMLANNEKINWIPAHIKDGRFGEWLKDLKDWSISRNRYWGTPLPIWECETCEQPVVVSGLQDLNARAATHNTFFAARHGHAEHNIGNPWVAAGPETKNRTSQLTDLGKQNAKHLAEKLKKEKIDVIISSPYKRARDTARIIAKATGAKVIVDERLKEMQSGDFNWKLDSAYKGYFRNKLERFTIKPPGRGAETLTEVKLRMLAAIFELNKKYKDKKILLVSHGDPLWLLEGGLRGLANEELLSSDYYPNHDAYIKLPLSNWPYTKEGGIDLHRPYIDGVALQCPKCKQPMQRVKDVLDVWFDSGAMPYASAHFPFAQSNREYRGLSQNIANKDIEAAFKQLDYPADYISEGIDQTRGWFYTLLAISTLLGLEPAYKNVICVGLVLDKNGQKMSKSKGNIINPNEMMEKYGADALRWYFYTINDPGDPKRFNEEDLAKTTRKFILIVYNSFVFWNSYGKRHETPKETYELKNVLDRWILAELNQLVKTVTKKLEQYEVGEAGRSIEAFTDNLSRWYIRRSRDRFQGVARNQSSDLRDWEAASYTLQTVLLTLSKLVAPMMPFFAEALYVSVGGTKESVHLEDWPTAKEELIDEELLKDMNSVRVSAAQALSARADAKLKVRQPLASLTLKDNTLENKDELIEILRDEVNVKAILFNSKLTEEKGLKLDIALTPELREEGIIRELSRAIQGLRQDAGYQLGDEIVLYIDGPDALTDIIQRSSIQLKKAVNAKQLELKKTDKFDAELSTKVDEWEIWVGVQK